MNNSIVMNLAAAMLALQHSTERITLKTSGLVIIGINRRGGGGSEVDRRLCRHGNNPNNSYRRLPRKQRRKHQEDLSQRPWYNHYSGSLRSPFYARTFLSTGNPVYPFFADLFSSNPASMIVSKYHSDVGSLKYGLSGLSGLVFSPIFLSFQTSAMTRLFDGSFGWQFMLILAILLHAVLASLRGRNFMNVVYPAAAAMLYIAWFLSASQARFLLPAFFIAAFAAQFSMTGLHTRMRRILLATILVATALSFSLPQLKHYLNSWKAAIGCVRIEDYLCSATGEGYLEAVNVIHDMTEKDCTVLLVFENRGLYIPGGISSGRLSSKNLPSPRQKISQTQNA